MVLLFLFIGDIWVRRIRDYGLLLRLTNNFLKDPYFRGKYRKILKFILLKIYAKPKVIFVEVYINLILIIYNSLKESLSTYNP